MCVCDDITGPQKIPASSRIDAQIFVADEAFRFDGGDRVIVDPDSFVYLHLHDGFEAVLIHRYFLHPADTDPQNVHRAADPQAGDSIEFCRERIGIASQEIDLAQFYSHIAYAEQAQDNKDTDDSFHGVFFHFYTPGAQLRRPISFCCKTARATTVSTSMEGCPSAMPAVMVA